MARSYQLSITLLLFLSVQVVAQETAATCGTSSLYGQVISSDPEKPLQGAQIAAKRVGDKGTLDQEESQKNWYCVKVPSFTKVFLFFQSDGFDPQSSMDIDTGVARKRHSWPIPIIKLDPIEFGQREAHQQTPQQKRERLRAKLSKHKDSLSSAGSNDIFIWNMELFKDTYREDPDSTAEINKFLTELKSDPEFYFLETAEYAQKSKLFRFIIARNQGRPAESEVTPADLLSLINSSSTFSSIRANAISVLPLLKNLTPADKEQIMAVLTKALDQDSSVAVRTKSAEVLGVLGDEPQVLTALRRAAEEDDSPEVKSAAGVAAELVARRPAGARMASSGMEQARITTTTTQTTAVQNADGSWTVVEYPVDKEVMVDLTPSTKDITGMARARVLRSANGTVITVDPAGFVGATGNYNLYAVDPMGHASLLGPINATSTSPLTYNTNLGQFMLVVSPEGNLTTYNPNTTIAYRSAVPQGFAVIPVAQSGSKDGAPIGERVSATTTSGATPGYVAPMLGIPGFRRGTDTEVKIKFSGAMTGARANIKVEPRKDGPTTIKMRFHELKEAPAGQVYAVWAVSPDNKFVKLGQIVNTGGRNEAQIQAETSLTDFGLLLTLENGSMTPTGEVVGTIIR